MQIKTLIGCVVTAIVCLAFGTQAAAQSKVYWTDNSITGMIWRANLDGTGVETLVNVRTSSGIALDVVGGKMYWADFASGPIARANLDGTGVEDLVSDSQSGQSTGLALDLAGGKMYWTEPGVDKIQRANLDGSGVEDLVTTGLQFPQGIALDVAGGKMYWTGAGGTPKIQRANLDGSGVEDLVTAGLQFPPGIALDVAGRKMYWVDFGFGTSKIQRANLDGGGVEDLVTAQQLENPSGIALDVSGGKMYWTDATEDGDGQIRRANLDGSGIEDLVTGGIGSPSGIALALGGGGGGSDITWNVTGIDVDLVVCKNKTTNQKGRIDTGVPTSGSCGDLGLVWDPGDNVQIKAVGTVVSVADAGGNVTGIVSNLVVCKNRSTEPKEKVRLEPPPSPWNCTDAGLPLAVGERLQWKAKGPAN